MSMFYTALALTLFSTLCLVAYLLLGKEPGQDFDRLVEVTRSAEARVETPSGARKLGALSLASATWLRSHFGITDDASLQMRFARAGLKGTMPADMYLSARILGPVVALLVGSLLPHARFFMIASPAVVYLLPDLILERMIKRRREKIRRGVPDVIDLLVICVDAGLGLDQAIMRVGQELAISHPEINDEFLQLNREQRAGRLRAEAWAGVADRVKVQDIDSFVNMLMQTDRFGTPISKALTTFAQGIRTKRRQAAEEMAAKTTIKIIFPLVFFIFPAIFVVLLGPAVLSMIHGVGGGF
jgi:tight adherence protein C